MTYTHTAREVQMPTRVRAKPKSRAQYVPAGRAAREYAEQWYQALRVWDVVPVKVPEPKISYWQFRDEPPPDFSTLGEQGPTPKTAINTPAGQISETEVASLISLCERSSVPEQQAMGKLLHRLRQSQRAPRSLVRPDGGWAPQRPVSAGYAVCVLTLAVQFGDRRAERFLPYCRACMKREA